MAKIDWYAARVEYINSPTLTLRELAEKYKISEQSMFLRSKKEGWLNRRITHLAKLEQKLADKTGNDIVNEKARLLREAKFVASKGLLGVSIHTPRTAREGGELWERGAKVQTQILGIDSKSQINIQQNNLQQNNTILSLTDIITKIKERAKAEVA